MRKEQLEELKTLKRKLEEDMEDLFRRMDSKIDSSRCLNQVSELVGLMYHHGYNSTCLRWVHPELHEDYESAKESIESYRTIIEEHITEANKVLNDQNKEN